jgi:hypothetical protein
MLGGCLGEYKGVPARIPRINHDSSPCPRAGVPGASHTAACGHVDGPGRQLKVAYHPLNTFLEALRHATRQNAPLLVEKAKAITPTLRELKGSKWIVGAWSKVAGTP